MRSGQETNRKRWWLTAGGAVGAVLASSCCIAPLVLFLLGISGAWISNLTALEPYQPVFITITLGLLGAGFWMVYFKPRRQCAESAYCSKPEAGKLLKNLLWGSTGLIVIAIAFPYIVPWLLY